MFSLINFTFTFKLQKMLKFHFVKICLREYANKTIVDLNAYLHIADLVLNIFTFFLIFILQSHKT